MLLGLFGYVRIEEFLVGYEVGLNFGLVGIIRGLIIVLCFFGVDVVSGVN